MDKTMTNDIESQKFVQQIGDIVEENERLATDDVSLLL